MSHPTGRPSSWRTDIPSPSWDDDEDREAWRIYQERRRQAYEDRAAKEILAFYGKQEYGRRIVQSSGHLLLSLRSISHLTPLPFRMAADVLAYMHRVSMTDVVKRFTKTPIFKALADADQALEDLYPDDASPICLIFPWPGVSRYVAAYRGIPKENPETFRISKVVRGEAINIEPLRDLLSAYE